MGNFRWYKFSRCLWTDLFPQKITKTEVDDVIMCVHQYELVPDTFVVVKVSSTHRTDRCISLLLRFLVQCCFFSSHVGRGYKLVGVWSECHAFVLQKYLLKSLGAFSRIFAPAKISHYAVHIKVIQKPNTQVIKANQSLLSLNYD